MQVLQIAGSERCNTIFLLRPKENGPGFSSSKKIIYLSDNDKQVLPRDISPGLPQSIL